MKRRRNTPKPIVGKFRVADQLPDECILVGQMFKHLVVIEHTDYR